MENYKNVAITFHGLDTVADIVLNGKVIGSTNNMFVRWTFDVKELLNGVGVSFKFSSFSSNLNDDNAGRESFGGSIQSAHPRGVEYGQSLESDSA